MTQADLDFHGFTLDPADGHLSLTVEHRLCTPFGFLYGGAGLSSAITAAEAVAAKPVVWITAQYVSNALPGEVVEYRTQVVADGRRTTQVQVNAVVGNRLILSTMSAHSDRPDGDEAHCGEPPLIPPPEECEPWSLPFDLLQDNPCFVDAMDRRSVKDADAAADGHLRMWVRIPSWSGPSAARLGYVADVVPGALFQAFRRDPGATSLDNTLRVLDPDTGDWMLMDVEAHGVARSIGHGQVRIWSRDGRLLAIGSQSAIMRTSHIADKLASAVR